MKRHLIGIFLFTAIVAASTALLSIGTAKSPEKTEPFIHLETVVSLDESKEKPPKDDFIPEFFDLPNFGEPDIDAEIVYNREERFIDIFDEGIYRKSEVVAKNGESWFVLTKNETGYELQRSTARVRKLKTVSWTGDETDAKLSFNTKGKPIFAVRNFAWLKPGPVPTLFQRKVWDDNDEADIDHEELSDGYRREFQLGSNKYILRTSRGITRDGTKTAVLVLELNGVSQVISQNFHSPTDDRDIIGSLLWVGDLDNDGKLDIYFDISNEKGAIVSELHLSTEAKQEKLVGFAASFGTSGC